MDAVTCRLLPFLIADGAYNMAADEALLHSAVNGTASLRFYATDVTPLASRLPRESRSWSFRSWRHVVGF